MNTERAGFDPYPIETGRAMLDREVPKNIGELFRMVDGIMTTIHLCDKAQSRIGQSLDRAGLLLPWPEISAKDIPIEYEEDTLLHQLSLMFTIARDLQERLDHHADTLSKLV